MTRQPTLPDPADDNPAQPGRQPNERSEAGANPTAAATVDTGSPHWRICEGGYGILASGSSKRRWWRCPSCGWVGFQINSDTPPALPTHQTPRSTP